MDDLIEGFDRYSLDEDEEPPQLIEKPETLQKISKWLSKTLESVHSNEVGKIGTRSSYKNRIEDGAVEDSDSGNDIKDMECSFDCELNFSTDCELTSFKEAFSHDVWKDAMKKEHDALINNGTWKLVDPPYGTKSIGCKWVYKNKYRSDGSLEKYKARLVAKSFA